jgi:hypothetical protein
VSQAAHRIPVTSREADHPIRSLRFIFTRPGTGGFNNIYKKYWRKNDTSFENKTVVPSYRDGTDAGSSMGCICGRSY